MNVLNFLVLKQKYVFEHSGEGINYCHLSNAKLF